ncbi:MAG: amidohydrolase [Janthinobacterium lividum]
MRYLLLTALLLLPAAGRAQAPDFILTGGKIFTAEPARLYVQALAVRGERIVAVGSTAAIQKLAGPHTRRITLRGRVVVPGFNDAHAHLPQGYPTGYFFEFPDAPMIPGPAPAAVLDTLVALVRRVPPGTWLEAEVGLRVFNDPQLRRAALDRVAPAHPVALHTPWGHGCIYNSLALQQLGISEASPDPLGGRYERQPGTGQLTGLLTEYADWNARRNLQGRLPDSVWARQLRQFGTEAVQLGITSVQDMASELPPAQMLRVTQLAHLPLRHRIIAFPMTTPAGIRYQEWRGLERHPAPLARVDGVKYILDATPLDTNAVRRRPYPGRPGWYGRLNFPPDTLRQLLRQALASPQQLMLHVAGDSTAALVLSLMHELADDATWRRKRVRFEHGDRLAPDLWPRARALGIVVVENPTHYLNPAIDPAHAVPGGLRAPFRSLLAAGIPLAFGSDGPVNPGLNLLAAITLADKNECLTREQAVRAYTAGAAYAEFEEEQKGTLAPGKLADLAVLSQDIFTVPTEALPGTVSVLTMVDGRVVYEAGR